VTESSEPKKGLIRRAVDAGKADLERSREAAAANAAAVAANPPPTAPSSVAPTPQQRFEYRVDQVRETMFGDKVKTDALEQVLTKRAREGWQLRTVTAANVGGRVGPGGVSGLLVVFERPVASA
jgi:hypothetical protein